MFALVAVLLIRGDNCFKDKLIGLIERAFQREGSPYLACNDRNAFLHHAWSCQNVCEALTFLLDNIFIRYCTKLYRQVVWIPVALIVLHWLPIYSCFVLRETS